MANSIAGVVPPANPTAPIKLTGDDLNAAKKALSSVENSRANMTVLHSQICTKAARARLEAEGAKANPDFTKMVADSQILNTEFRDGAKRECQKWLKHSIKSALAGITPIVAKAIASQAEAIRVKCNELEAPERAAAEEHGVPFQPSQTLRQLRESFARCRTRHAQLESGTACTEQELRGVLEGGSFVASGNAAISRQTRAEVDSSVEIAAH